MGVFVRGLGGDVPMQVNVSLWQTRKVQFAAPGLERGLSGTGAILRVRLTVRSTTVVRFGTQSILRDLSNRDIPLRFRGAEIFAN